MVTGVELFFIITFSRAHRSYVFARFSRLEARYARLEPGAFQSSDYGVYQTERLVGFRDICQTSVPSLLHFSAPVLL